MCLRYITALFLACSLYGAEWFLAETGSRGLGFLALSPDYHFDAARHNPAVLPQETAYQLSYSPMWSEYGIQELSLALFHKALPLKPVFYLNGQMHELINSYAAKIQLRLYHSESLDIGGAMEWSMLQIANENATHRGNISLGFIFYALENMTLGVSYLHLAEFPQRSLLQQMPLFNLAANYRLGNIALMAGYQKPERYGGAAALGIQGHYRGLISYGLSWNGANEMLSANLSIAWRKMQFRQAAGWHRWLGLIPIWSIEFLDK